MRESAQAVRIVASVATRCAALCLAALLVLALSVALIAGSLTAVVPAGASALVPITITGTGFDATASKNEVVFVHTDGTTKTAVGEAVSTLNATTGRRTLTVRVPAELPVGRANLTVRNTVSNETSSGMALDILAISLPDVRSAAQGASGVQVRITGSSNVRFVAGGTAVSFPAAIGVTVASTTIESPTSLLAVVNIASSAATGAKNVQVKTSTQTALLVTGFQITAPTPPNRAPLISSSPSLAAVTGQPYGYAVQASDPDGDVVTFSLTQAPAGMTMGATGVIGWTPGAAQVGPHAVTVQVVDGKGGIVTQSFTIQVTAANHPPVITSAPVVSGTEAVSYRYQLVATDPDGDGLTYTLTPFPSGMTVTAAGLLAWTPSAAQVGAQPVTVGVSDGKGGAASQSFTITVAAANHPPVITSAPVVSGTEAVSYRYQLVATDPDGDGLTYTLTPFPSGMTVTAAGLLAWTPSAAQVGAQPVTVGVSDGKGGAASQSFTITVAAANHPPVITSAPVVSGTEAVSYRYQLVATDPDGDGLTYTLTPFPSGMTVTAAGLLAWTPSAAQVGAQPVTVGVSDGKGGAVSQSFTITVAAANHAPVITSPPALSASEARPYTYQVTASDADGDPLTFTLAQAPAGMTISTTGLAAWTPTALQAGPQDVVVRVADGRGGVANQPFTIDVAANRAPTVTSQPVVVGLEAAPYRYQVEASDPDGEALTYVLTAFPDGMTVSSSGLITWTPAVNQTGPKAVALEVTDSRGGKFTQSFTVTVAAANHRPTARAGGPYAGTAGDAIQFDASASTDPDAGDTLTFAWDFGDATNGQGPSLAHAYATDGPFTATLTVTDNRGSVDTASVTVTVTVAAVSQHGVIAGRVVNDLDNQPLDGAAIELVSVDGQPPNVVTTSATTEKSGRFHLSASPGLARLRITRADFIGAERTVQVVAGKRVDPLDARLTSLDAQATAVSSVAGGIPLNTAGDAKLTVGAGSLAQDTSLVLTRLSGQGCDSAAAAWLVAGRRDRRFAARCRVFLSGDARHDGASRDFRRGARTCGALERRRGRMGGGRRRDALVRRQAAAGNRRANRSVRVCHRRCSA